MGKILLMIGIGWFVAGIGCFAATAPFAYLFNSFGPAIMNGANPFGIAVAIWLTIALAFGWTVLLTIGVFRLFQQH
jgi:hypothetical protein